MTTLEKLEELLYHGFGETDRRFQETDRKFQETDRKFQERIQERDKEFEKTRLLFQEVAASQRETGRQLDELKQHVRGVTDSLGLFAENMVLPSAVRLFRERGLEINELGSRFRSRYNGETMEVDIIGSGPGIVLAIEVKLRLRQSHVEKFLEKLNNFFKFYPRYHGLTLYGAIGGMSIDAEVDRLQSGPVCFEAVRRQHANLERPKLRAAGFRQFTSKYSARS